MAEDWYYAIEGERHGPVSGRDLKQLAKVGKLKPTDLIWRSGMADWRAAGSIRGLFIEGATSGRRSPPPLSKDQPASPPKGESDFGRIAQNLFDEIKMKATDVAVKVKTVARTVADGLAKESVAEKEQAILDSSSTAQETETNDSSPVTPHIRPSDASDEPISKGAAIGSKGAFWERLVRCLTIVWNGSKSFWLRYAAWLLQFFRILRSGGGDNKKATEKSTVSESEVIQLSLMDVFRTGATDRAKNVPNAVMFGNICHWVFVLAIVVKCLNGNESDVLKRDGTVPTANEIRSHENEHGEKPQYSSWDGSFNEVKKYLMVTLNDPGSVQYDFWSKVVMTDGGWEVRCRYRARNAFGALMLQSHIFTIRNGVVVSKREY
jgi:hypothetical protein